ncbi:conserved hypothetical protein [delta proteobacterium NaphS2]|nr:conserved hypothetical protein [delta proteobacterium NaphS2]
METEAGQQLEGIYGWLPEGRFADPTRYPAVKQIPEAAETRRSLEAYAEEEKNTGLSPRDARIKLVRETAFTWLNRLVALRMMEERGIIKSTVGRLDKSNSFIYWLTADGNDEMYALHQKGALPLNAMGEGPSDVAYRQFLLWQCGQLAGDVSVLFDPENLSSRLFPRPSVLKKLMESMNKEDLAEAWRTGNEETIGWIYEGFIEEENKAVFEKFGKGKKVKADEIGAATQRFTPRWIVRFLVENSLGRLWMEMHPDSRLKEKLEYFVPTQAIERSAESAKDITFLDPSCGSMHFGLLAFDIFFEMYREELAKAGQPGWPDKPSVASIKEIPASIIDNNIYGIDIDFRAVQLSALTLFLKARSLNKKCTFSDNNLACANVKAITGGRLEEFIKQSQFSHPIYERILRVIAVRMKDSDQLGSLLRLEKDLEFLIGEERKKVDKNKQLQFPFPGLPRDQFETKEGVEEFFEILFEQLLRHLDFFVQSSRATGVDPGHFAAEAAKGLRYLRLVSRQYDVVATNPPYLSRRNMSSFIAKHLDENYPNTKSDLYSAFIIRCLELAISVGKVAMVTQQSFMFIKAYEKMRKDLRKIAFVDSMAHLGPKAFPNITGEKVNTTAFILCKETSKQKRLEHQGIYFRLVRERDSQAKWRRFEEAVACLSCGKHSPIVFSYRQIDFDPIPSTPWVYWITEGIRTLFLNRPKFASFAKPWVGLQTSDNVRFLRFWWESGINQIAFVSSVKDAVESGKRWIPHMKGGEHCRWYGNQEFIVNWFDNGMEMKTYAEELKQRVKSPPGNGPLRDFPYYFLPGVTWTHTTAKGLNARYMPPGFICNVEGMACYPELEFGLVELSLAILNSKLACYITNQLNPTIHYGAREIGDLPSPSNLHAAAGMIRLSIQRAINLAKADSEENETTFDFIVPPDWPDGIQHVAERHASLSEIEQEINVEVFRFYNIDDRDRQAIETELFENIASLELDEAEETEQEGLRKNESMQPSWSCLDLSKMWISYAFGTVLGRYGIGQADGFGRGNFDGETAAAIRTLMDEDAVMVSEAGHPQDITARTLRCLELMRGKETAHALIREVAGSDGDPEELLRGFLDRFTGKPEVSFWRHHFQLYRKRPIFWPLQSPKRKFAVWVFQERFTTDTLFKVRSEFVDPKIRWLEARIREFKEKAEGSTGAEKRGAEKEVSQLSDILDDVQEFSKRLDAVIQGGYTPHIDDGVLLNAAPLWELLPSWPDTKKAWQELEKGKYDWAHQAMDHWPDRVREKCKTNKSFAIAHGLE